jgi:hypothetical protein
MSQFNPTNNPGLRSFFKNAKEYTIGTMTVHSIGGDSHTDNSVHTYRTTFSPPGFQSWGSSDHNKYPSYGFREALSPEADAVDLDTYENSAPTMGDPSWTGSASNSKSKAEKVKVRMSSKRDQDGKRPMQMRGRHHKQEDLKKVLEKRAYRNRVIPRRRLEVSERSQGRSRDSAMPLAVKPSWNVMKMNVSGQKLTTTLVGRHDTTRQEHTSTYRIYNGNILDASFSSRRYQLPEFEPDKLQMTFGSASGTNALNFGPREASSTSQFEDEVGEDEE